VKEVNLFVSTFDKGEGLLPWDKVVDLSDSTLLPELSQTQKRELLSKPWNGYDDFNPNRILTATWKKDSGKWYGYDGVTPIDQPLNDPANTRTSFTLPKSLTAGQKYNFAVEAISNSGAVTKDFGQFKTIPTVSNSPFSSVSVLTPGFTLLPGNAGIPDSFYQMANKIATVSGNTPESSGLMMRYDKPTGNWVPIDGDGRVITELTGELETSEPNYLSTLANNLKNGVVIDGKQIKYLNQNKPLVLLPEWSLDRESVIPDVGFSEGAADALFASMVQLDQALGGGVGGEINQVKRLYDDSGNLIRTQGAVFNSPLHFVGFSRGAVVNSEIIQRFGTYFPDAGGVKGGIKDLQMTTVDPHDFYQPSLNLTLPGFVSTNFSDFYEPKVQVWNNVTFSDNYYQTVANPNGFTATPNGRSLGQLPQEELDLERKSKFAGLNFPQVNGVNLGQPDLEVLLGTREGQPGRENSRIGFTKDDMLGSPHQRANAWYAGTVDLNLDRVQSQFPHASNPNVPEPINDQLGERDISRWFDPNFPDAKPWYENANGEGVGEGWFYSVLGGGQRLGNMSQRVSVSFDNTLSASMRGDYAVPTLFNGNFDQYIPNKSEFEDFGRNAISKEIPGWSFHNGLPQVAQEQTPKTKPATTANLVDWKAITSLNTPYNYSDGTQIPGTSFLERMGINSDPNFSNYALELKGGDSITHNRFVVPDWGSLRFNIHVPQTELAKGGAVKVFIQGDAEGYETYKEIGNVELKMAQGNGASYEQDTERIDYATRGFETFNVDVPDQLRGKSATLKFEVIGDRKPTVFLDDVFFQSVALKFGEPKPKEGNARSSERRVARYSDAQFKDNFYKDSLLMERPQYTLSYNGLDGTNIPNWVSFQINKSWIPIKATIGKAQEPTFDGSRSQFIDRSLTEKGFYSVPDKGYANAPTNYSKGHLTPLSSRARNDKDSVAVNVMSNFVPQQKNNNFPIWESIENYAQDFVKQGKEVYIITGPDKSKGNFIGNNSELLPQNIGIPEKLWKVMLVLDSPYADITTSPVYAVGFYLNNDNYKDPTTGQIIPWIKDWRKKSGQWDENPKENRIVWSVKEIEDETGYEFFSNLPPEIKSRIQDVRYIFPKEANIRDNWRDRPWETPTTSNSEEGENTETNEPPIEDPFVPLMSE
jgi:DNA/RNA endonuclease G (NUC1)